MDSAITSQVVAVTATLSAVALTQLANMFLERRRARDAHRLESLRVAAEHTKWLRDERMKAYATFSLTGEEVLQFLRAELPALVEADDARRVATEARWAELRIEFRKAYNQVLLLGAEGARSAAVDFWRTGRDYGNDLLRDGAALPEGAAVLADYLEELREARARLGTRANEFIEACRSDLQQAVEGRAADAVDARDSPVTAG